jgi:hypothetical protein
MQKESNGQGLRGYMKSKDYEAKKATYVENRAAGQSEEDAAAQFDE